MKDRKLIYETDSQGSTALHVACEWSYLEIVELFFEAGGKDLVYIKNGEGEDALEFSYSENQHDPYTFLCTKLGVK